MAKPRVPQNLPPESQQWVRDVERRLNDLEVQSQRLTRSVTQNAGQIDSISKALLMAQTSAQVDSNRYMTFVGGSGEISIEFVRPEWANRGVVLTTVNLDMTMMPGSSPTSWTASITGMLYIATSGDETGLGAVAGTEASIYPGGPDFVGASNTGTFNVWPLTPDTKGIILRGQWSTASMPALQSSATFSISSLALWYASTEDE